MGVELIFSERLRECMDEKGITVSALARELGLSRVTVSRLKSGAHAPSTENLLSIAEYFHCSADYLLGREELPRDKVQKSAKPFGEVLRACIKQSGISVYKFEKDLNLSSSLTYRWLFLDTVPNVETCIRLAGYFDCSVDYLLGRE